MCCLLLAKYCIILLTKYFITGFDLDTAKYILKNLATLHGVPLALKLKRPKEFKEKILPHINIIKLFNEFGENTLKFVVKLFECSSFQLFVEYSVIVLSD